MSNPNTPAGGKPANLPAETSAKPAKRNTLAMSVHIPDDWNPHTELLAIADYARNLCKRSERENAPERPIPASQVREINMMACLLAMRLSACRITIPREDSPAEMIAEIAAYTGPAYGRMSEAYAARQALPDHPAEAEESLRATVAAVRAEAKAEAANAAAKAAAATLESARSAASK